jgi:putative addiction module CopG family antidote
MPNPIPLDIQDLIAAQLATGRYRNEDEVLREALRALQELSDDGAAVQEAIDAWRAGDDGLALDQAFDLVRKDFAEKPKA